jgi:hypothetical protein
MRADQFRRGPDGSAVIKLGTRERLLLRQLLVELQVRLGSRPARGGPPASAPGAVPGALPGAAAGAAPAAVPATDEVQQLFDSLRAPDEAAVTARLPRDPTLARLFPDAYAADVEDGQAQSDFRRFTEPELLAQKVANGQLLLDSLADERTSRVTVASDDVERWLFALNDLRLFLGTELGVDEIGTRPRPGEPGFARYVAYAWLTDLQASLVAVVAV